MLLNSTIDEKFNLILPDQNGIWVKFYHLWPKNDCEKWRRKNIFEILPCGKPKSDPLIYFKEWGIFYKITNSITKLTLFAHERTQYLYLR